MGILASKQMGAARIVLERKINPGKVFDFELPLADAAEGYRLTLVPNLGGP